MTASHRIILGNAFRLSLPTGQQLQARHRASGTTTSTDVTSADDVASFTPSAAGRYYLLTREDSTSDWCEAGILHVVEAVNTQYEDIVAELDTVNELLASAGTVNELIQYEVTTPDGTAVKRMTVRQLLKHRADLEARVVAIERRYSGRLPVRLN